MSVNTRIVELAGIGPSIMMLRRDELQSVLTRSLIDIQASIICPKVLLWKRTAHLEAFFAELKDIESRYQELLAGYGIFTNNVNVLVTVRKLSELPSYNEVISGLVQYQTKVQRSMVFRNIDWAKQRLRNRYISWEDNVIVVELLCSAGRVSGYTTDITYENMPWLYVIDGVNIEFLPDWQSIVVGGNAYNIPKTEAELAILIAKEKQQEV